MDRVGYRAIKLHGGMGEEQREKSLERFKDRKFNVLVATDVAARGIDVPGVSLVINYDTPNDIKHYPHRIGRMYGTDVFFDLKLLIVENRSPVRQEKARH